MHPMRLICPLLSTFSNTIHRGMYPRRGSHMHQRSLPLKTRPWFQICLHRHSSRR